MKYVQWIGKDGGWKTGEIVVIDGAKIQTFKTTLVKHSHTGELEFVEESKLERRPMREEYETLLKETSKVREAALSPPEGY